MQFKITGLFYAAGSKWLCFEKLKENFLCYALIKGWIHDACEMFMVSSHSNLLRIFVSNYGIMSLLGLRLTIDCVWNSKCVLKWL